MKLLSHVYAHINPDDTASSRSALLRHLIMCSVGTCIANTFAIGGLLVWEQAPMHGPGPFKRGAALYTMPTEIGLIIFLYFAALSVILAFITVDAWLRYAICYGSKTAVYIAMLVRCVLCMSYIGVTIASLILWAADPLECGIIFCLGQKYSTRLLKRGRTGMYFHINIAVMSFCGIVPFALFGLYHTLRLWPTVQKLSFEDLSSRERDGDSASRLHTNATDVYFSLSRFAKTVMHVRRTPSTRSRIAKLSLVVVVLLFFACLTFYMPGSTTWVFDARRIAQLARVQPSMGIVNANNTSPELLNAVFRTRGVRISEALCLKLYPGNVFFYSYLLLVLLLLWVLQFNSKLRYLAHRRFVLYPSMTCYEAVCLVLTMLLIVVFSIYWMHDHNYKGIWRADKPVKGYLSLVEVFARGWGQVATLFMSLLMFPISKNSIVFQVIGISSDKFLPVHRILGYAMLAATAIHAVLFYVRFYQQGALKHNLFHTPTKVSIRQHRSDYTVIAVTGTTVLLFVSMGLLALSSVRRRFYELFYFSHIIAAHASIPVILWHAAAGWELLLPALTLWLADLVMQYNQSSALVVVRRACAVTEDTVELQFQVAWPATVVYPGQYVMINIPEISVLQWHPFTLSSVARPSSSVASQRRVASSTPVTDSSTTNTPTRAESPAMMPMHVDDEGKLVRVSQAYGEFSSTSSSNETSSLSASEVSGGSVNVDAAATAVHNTLTIHIKVMAPNSWTDRLYRRVEAKEPLTMSVKGPYGEALDLTTYTDVFLVCGGIGVTPCASIFGSLLRQRLHEWGCETMTPVRVRLIWATRSAALVTSMSKILCLPPTTRQRFDDSVKTSQLPSNHIVPAAVLAREGDDVVTATHVTKDAMRCTPVSGQELGDGSIALGEMDDICRELRRCFQCRLFFTVDESYREGCQNWPFACADVSGMVPELNQQPQTNENEQLTSHAELHMRGEPKHAPPPPCRESVTAPPVVEACRTHERALTSLSIHCGRPDFSMELEWEISCLIRDAESSFCRERAIIVTCGAPSLMQDVACVGARLGVRVEVYSFEF